MTLLAHSLSDTERAQLPLRWVTAVIGHNLCVDVVLPGVGTTYADLQLEIEAMGATDDGSHVFLWSASRISIFSRMVFAAGVRRSVGQDRHDRIDLDLMHSGSVGELAAKCIRRRLALSPTLIF